MGIQVHPHTVLVVDSTVGLALGILSLAGNKISLNLSRQERNFRNPQYSEYNLPWRVLAHPVWSVFPNNSSRTPTSNAQFIRLVDSFVEVPEGKQSNSYADVDIIVNVADEQGVDAVWPGWGHASENPKLPSKLSVFGDKIGATIHEQIAKVQYVHTVDPIEWIFRRIGRQYTFGRFD